MIFQSTLSVRRATGVVYAVDAGDCISIHALRKESDRRVLVDAPIGALFQSTLSVRRATELSAASYAHDAVFQSTLSVRRATDDDPSSELPRVFQSTLSVRRATAPAPRENAKEKFQSTLSVRRATLNLDARLQFESISIHALRKESDRDGMRVERAGVEFQSTLSVRRATSLSGWSGRLDLFQSTLSVRRATRSVWPQAR